MSAILQANDISKSFKSVQALDGVSLAVNPGERVALLGHNGAGKTTLFRVALGFLAADSGSLKVCGHEPGSREARRAISYLPESVVFPKMLTGREIVTYYANLKNASSQDVGKALEQVELSDAADRRCGTYSKGMRQRLGLAQALVGKPKLLLLDEPTSGLDPLSRQHFYEVIAEIAGTGTAVLLSSHGLSELEARTDRVAILRKGALVADAPIRDLQAAANLPIRFRVTSTPDAVETVHAKFGGHRLNGASVEFLCEHPSKMQRLNSLSKMGDAVRDVELLPPTLDEIYRYFSRDDATGERT